MNSNNIVNPYKVKVQCSNVVDEVRCKNYFGLPIGPAYANKDWSDCAACMLKKWYSYNYENKNN